MRRAAILSLLLIFGSGCAAHRFVAPEPPPMPVEPPADLTHVALTVDDFHLTNLSRADRKKWDVERVMQRRFVDYVEQSASFGLFLPNVARARTLRVSDSLEHVAIDVQIAVEETANYTILFDGLFFYPFMGALPFTPRWGEAIVTGTIRWRRNGEREAPIVVRVSAPYSVIFYSWYRVGPVEEAFKRAHGKLYAEMVSKLIAQIGERPPPPPPPVELAVATSSTATLAPALPILASQVKTEASPLMKAYYAVLAATPSSIILPPDEAGVIFRPVHNKNEPTWLSRYLSSLGGVEISLTGGAAIVESRARTPGGLNETVGSGRATSSGYRISLFKPPQVTGFFYPPTVGFLSQTITISGFRDDTPLFTPEGSQSIPARVTDPATGMPVDIGEPIAYRLKLRSGHVGQSVGLNLVIGDEDVQLFSTAVVGINVLEVRHSDVQLYRSRVKGASFAAFQSGNLGGQIGLAIPSLHMAIRAAGSIGWYAAFSYPQSLEFQARSAFNPEKEAYERALVYVDGASLFTFDWVLSVVGLF
jgi:hypothetical protein